MDAVRKRQIEVIGAGLPEGLRRLRAQMMLKSGMRYIGMKDVVCPGCGGRQRLGDDVLEACPICGGFGAVPEALAVHVRAQMAARTGARRAYA